MNVLVTNNPLAAEAYRGRLRLEYSDCSLSELLIVIRGLIHAGHRLLTHPLSGSVKPNETPYKSIAMSGPYDALDFDSLKLIEDCIIMCRNFTARDREMPGHVLNEMQTVDYGLIYPI